jgi:hypothetical protein
MHGAWQLAVMIFALLKEFDFLATFETAGQPGHDSVLARIQLPPNSRASRLSRALGQLPKLLLAASQSQSAIAVELST